MNKKAIPQKARICKALIEGEVLTMMDGYYRFKCTNISREISRQIEKKFGVTVSKDEVKFFYDCGTPGSFFRYRLNHTEANLEGIEKIKVYVAEFFPKKEEVTAIAQNLMF